MMKRYALALTLMVGLVCGGIAVAEKVSMEGVKCLVAASKDAKVDNAVDYRDGKVYFCCQNCPKAFEKDKAKFATKANHQLVATKQYEQGGCPYSGAKLDPSTAIEIAGTKVAFCCNNCKGKAEKMKDDEKLESVFSDKSFEKGKFAKVAVK
jgi:YHS domain-containing protein